MNISALNTAFTSLNFRARLHGAMRRAIKNECVGMYVKNRKGENCLRVRWDIIGGFQFNRKNVIIPNIEIFKHLRAA